MTDRPATEPRTEAGRALIARMMILFRAQHESVEAFTADILAIEAEKDAEYERVVDLYRRQRDEAEAARGAAPRAEGLDAALADILRWTKPGSLYADGTNGYSPAGPEKVARIHNRARAAFGDAPLPPSEGAAPRAEGLDANALASALYRGYDYTVTPDDIRDALTRLSRPSDEKEES